MEDLCKQFNRFCARLLILFTLFIARVVPYRCIKAFSRFVVLTVFYRIKSRLFKNAVNSLDIAFGDKKSSKEKQALVKATFINLADIIAEGICYYVHPEVFEQDITVEGEQHLKAALDKGNGVLAITGHLGNFPLMMGVFARRGYKMNVLMRPPRDEKIGLSIAKRFNTFGGNIIFTVPEKSCVQQSIKALRNNEVLVVLIDQNYGAGARVFVDFFGKKAATGASPVTFAWRTGASVVPMFSVRSAEGCTAIVVDKEVGIERHERSQESLQKQIQLLTLIIEKYVCNYPELWSWMHNRWKSKPMESDKLVS